MGTRISSLPAATSLTNSEIIPIVQAGATKQVSASILRNPTGSAGGDLTGSYPSPTLAASGVVAQTVGSTTLTPVLTVDSKGRITAISTAAKPQGTVTSVSAGTGLTGGPITATGSLSVAYGTTAGTSCQGNDSRLSDSRAPIGAAGGDLTGSYPNPNLANISTPGSAGSGTSVPVITIDSKGRVTALSSAAITGIPTASSSFPSANTGAVIGTSGQFARGDHAHPLQVVSVTGDATGTGTSTVPVTLATTGVAPATYGSGLSVPVVTVDAKGRITNATTTPVVSPYDKTSSSSANITDSILDFTVSSSSPWSVGMPITALPVSGSSYYASGTVLAVSATAISINVTSSVGTGTFSNWILRQGANSSGGGGSGNATQLQGRSVSSTAPTSGQSLAWNGSTWIPTTISGGSGNATQLQSRNVSSTAPSDQQCLAWNSGTSTWEPQAKGSSANATSIQGVSVDSTAPTSGQVLGYNGSSWIPTTASGGSSDTGRAWSSSVTYSTGDVVSDGDYVYVARTTTTNNQPVSSPVQWQRIAAEGRSWSSGIVYAIGDVVEYNGIMWVGTSPSYGSTPTVGGGYWQAVGPTVASMAPSNDGGLATAGVTVAGWMDVLIGTTYYKMPYFQ